MKLNQIKLHYAIYFRLKDYIWPVGGKQRTSMQKISKIELKSGWKQEKTLYLISFEFNTNYIK